MWEMAVSVATAPVQSQEHVSVLDPSSPQAAEGDIKAPHALSPWYTLACSTVSTLVCFPAGRESWGFPSLILTTGSTEPSGWWDREHNPCLSCHCV